MSIRYYDSGMAGVVAKEGQSGMHPTGWGTEGRAVRPGYSDTMGGAERTTNQTVQLPRDCSLCLHPVRSPEVARSESRTRSSRTDQQR